MVAVVDLFGKPLMPTNEYRARRLLKQKKAKIFGYRPFTIQLTERKSTEIQPIELCMDTGYIHIGISAKSERHEYLGMQIDTLTDEKLKRDDKRQYRRQRRNRKRYRAPRFDNRRRKEGWIAPSLEHKKEIHIDAIQRICKVMPITDITLEMGNFDTHVLKAVEEGKPLPQGSDYQHGERYGIATLREAVFLRDGYKCQCCEKSVKDGAILHVHHIKYRSQGGTNRMSNLITVCDKCHTPKNHKPGGKLWNGKPKLAEFKGASYMTSIRWTLYNEVTALLPNSSVHITYGAKTKESRRKLDIKKSHVNDAYVMGLFCPKHRTKPVYFKKKRRNNRVLEKFYDAKYIDSRDGKKQSGQELFNGRINRNHRKDSENLHLYRKQKVTKGKRSIRNKHYPIQPHDILLYQKKKYENAGCHNNGSRVILLPEKKSVALKQLTIYQYAGGYYRVPYESNKKEERTGS